MGSMGPAARDELEDEFDDDVDDGPIAIARGAAWRRSRRDDRRLDDRDP